MAEQKVTCTVCPLGCEISVETDAQGKIMSIDGNACKRGVAYATSEVTDPRRTLTTTMRVDGGETDLVSVKTDIPVPKGAMLDIMRAVSDKTAKAPVCMGDALIENILDTGSNIVATAPVFCYNEDDGNICTGIDGEDCDSPSRERVAPV